MWSTSNHGLVIILCNQSHWSTSLCNRVINILIKENFNKDKPSNRCFISVIGYGCEVKELCSGFLEDLYHNPIRVESKSQKVSDGNGGLVDVTVNQPFWVDPINEDIDTRVEDAITLAEQIIATWRKDWPYGPVPVVFDLGCVIATRKISYQHKSNHLFGIGSDSVSINNLYSYIPDYLYERTGTKPSSNGVITDLDRKIIMDITVYQNITE